MFYISPSKIDDIQFLPTLLQQYKVFIGNAKLIDDYIRTKDLQYLRQYKESIQQIYNMDYPLYYAKIDHPFFGIIEIPSNEFMII